MALVNYGVVSPSLTLTVQMELSDADSERIVAYLMAATPYGSVTENVITDIPNPAWSPDQGASGAKRDGPWSATRISGFERSPTPRSRHPRL